MSPFSNWNSEDDEILINFVRNHEAIYNTESKVYRKTQLKQNLWREIGEILNKTDNDCSKRWCYIRDYYVRRRGKPFTSGEAAKKRSIHLSFLDSLPSTQRNSATKADEDEPLRDCSDITEDTHNNSEHIFTIEYENIKTENSHNSDETLSDDSNTQEIGNVIMSDNKNDRKRNNNGYAKEFANRNCTQNELDENDLFFGSMAKIMKKLPQYEQVQLRMQIGTLVGTAELRHISNI